MGEEKYRMLQERFELSVNRIREIVKEVSVSEAFNDYFRELSELILLIIEPNYTKEYNEKLYSYILPKNYESSYANPKFCAKKWDKLTNKVNVQTLENTEKNDKNIQNNKKQNGPEKGFAEIKIPQMLCFLFSEIFGLIPYSFEQDYYKDDVTKEIITIYLELFIEIYLMFVDAKITGVDINGCEGDYAPGADELRDVLYWFESDYCDVISPYRIRQQLDYGLDFATNIVLSSDLGDGMNCDAPQNQEEYFPFYLYKYGEYITNNEIEVARFLAKLPQSDIDAMASTYTEGYRIGFVKASKPIEKKKTVNIRYNLGFERVVKAAIKNFNDMGLKPVIYRAGTLSLVKSGVNKIGYTGAIPNKQYDYDHREDLALYLDKDFVNRKTLVIKNAYEELKEKANTHAGPAVIEVFGEIPFSPEVKNECITLDVVGRKNQVDITDRLSQLTNEYIKGDERSFTIIAYPIPEIGDDFTEIFRETVKLNTLDYKRYESMQQHLIDVLDRADTVRIEGKGTNRTRLTIKTQLITDATKQTSFENCVADVNIPVGEVFTSPVLKGTDGVLNVSEVYLFGLNYIDLCITFKDGMIVDYSCSNFESEEENKKYIRENLLHNHETLPIGEFAIGTNTTAYRMARDYKIEDRMPILIGEKTGPHFAVGDTCYSHEEDVKVYNPDGKEIIARDNEITKKYRKTDPSKAYYNCHTDITIPYDELAGIYAVCSDGSEIAIIEDGRFVLPELSELNIPLDR